MAENVVMRAGELPDAAGGFQQTVLGVIGKYVPEYHVIHGADDHRVPSGTGRLVIPTTDIGVADRFPGLNIQFGDLVLHAGSGGEVMLFANALVQEPVIPDGGFSLETLFAEVTGTSAEAGGSLMDVVAQHVAEGTHVMEELFLLAENVVNTAVQVRAAELGAADL